MIKSNAGSAPATAESEKQEVREMADWVCKKCGFVRDSRCKPKKCPNCEAQNAFEKKEEAKKS
jgi:rubrerythrin